MKILSHRGWWKTPEEKNTPAAFDRSFSSGYGTETDFRDCLERLVISHDPAPHDALPADDFFAMHRAINPTLPLALNIKADGLQAMILAQVQAHDIQNYFVFDMAIPDALGYVRHGMRVFTRQSELEPEPAFYDEAVGVWLDAFYGEWHDDATLARHLDAGKQVCIVSPELHKREHRHLWDRLHAGPASSHPGVMLCTDFPDEARKVFDA